MGTPLDSIFFTHKKKSVTGLGIFAIADRKSIEIRSKPDSKKLGRFKSF